MSNIMLLETIRDMGVLLFILCNKY